MMSCLQALIRHPSTRLCVSNPVGDSWRLSTIRWPRPDACREGKMNAADQPMAFVST